MNERKLEGLYCEMFLVAAETFYPMVCSLTAGLCSFASQTALPRALPAVLSLLTHSTEAAMACNERCPAGTLALHAIATSFSPTGTPHELQGQNHHPGFGEALTSFFLLCHYILY